MFIWVFHHKLAMTQAYLLPFSPTADYSVVKVLVNMVSYCGAENYIEVTGNLKVSNVLVLVDMQ